MFDSTRSHGEPSDGGSHTDSSGDGATIGRPGSGFGAAGSARPFPESFTASPLSALARSAADEDVRALTDDDEIGSGYVPLAEVSLFDMLAAVQEMLERTREAPPAVVRPPEVTIPDCIEDILLRLQAAPGRQCRFVDLVDMPTTRIMVVMVFLAALELIRRRNVRVATGGEARQVIISLLD